MSYDNMVQIGLTVSILLAAGFAWIGAVCCFSEDRLIWALALTALGVGCLLSLYLIW